LLEITNRRRTGVAFSLGTWGLLLLLRGALLGAVTLFFDINFQTNILGAGSEIESDDREKRLLTQQLRSWELGTPED
jgi:hypothetical protein